MRKLGYILSTMLYLVMTVGVSLNSHYCGGRLLETYVYATPECPFCDFRGMEKDHEKDKECCDDETEFFAVDDDQQVLSTVSLDQRVDIFLYDICSAELLDVSEEKYTKINYDNSSPPPGDEDLINLYSQYLHYG